MYVHGNSTENYVFSLYLWQQCQSTPTAGLQMVTGALRGRGTVVQRRRILQSLRRLDPVSRSLQRLTTTYRRVYSVPGPNALW